ncbi:hypothetical protein KJ656_16880 [bacterium]|nr:hypothetical protein [bacterium]
MKRAVLITMIIAAFGLARAQDVIQSRDFVYTSYGQMIYWKTLTEEEKKVFLHAYLYRTHEIAEQMKQNRKLKSSAGKYVDELANPVCKIFQDLDNKKKKELIDWIDIFYRNEFNHKENFYNALTYAFQKLKTGRESMNDVYKRTYKQ